MNEIYDIAPVSTKPLIFISIFGMLMLFILGLFSYILYSSKYTTFEISEQGLRIQRTMYGRTLPARAFIPEEARQVNLRSDSMLRLRRRKNGVRLPGYQAGWFRMKNGDKALVFVTDPSCVVYLPTREGYALLLSVEKPDAFLQSFQRMISNLG